MKKYIITTLLGLIGMTAFTSAGYTSESEINSYSFTNKDYIGISDVDITNKYLCIETNNIPYYVNILNVANDDLIYVNQKVYCTNEKTSMPANITFTENTSRDSKQISGKLYYSNNVITYTEDTNGGGTTENNGNIIVGGVNDFSGIITKLGAIAGEFIPYIIYIAIACLGVSLAIGAVKYIIEYLKGNSYNSIQERNFRSEEWRENEFRKEGHTGKVWKQQAKYNAKNYDKLNKKANDRNNLVNKL